MSGPRSLYGYGGRLSRMTHPPEPELRTCTCYTSATHCGAHGKPSARVVWRTVWRYTRTVAGAEQTTLKEWELLSYTSAYLGTWADARELVRCVRYARAILGLA